MGFVRKLLRSVGLERRDWNAEGRRAGRGAVALSRKATPALQGLLRESMNGEQCFAALCILAQHCVTSRKMRLSSSNHSAFSKGVASICTPAIATALRVSTDEAGTLYRGASESISKGPWRIAGASEEESDKRAVALGILTSFGIAAPDVSDAAMTLLHAYCEQLLAAGR